MDGETLDLGNKSLRFIGASNLHWPDTIYTYLEPDKLLFTCDSFGAHFCHEKMFDDEVGNYEDAFKDYFDVILKPFSKFMLKAIEKVDKLELDMICPGHGPILRTGWKEKVELSRQYAKQYFDSQEGNENRVLIAYISAYGYTAEMARAIQDFEIGNRVFIDNHQVSQLTGAYRAQLVIHFQNFSCQKPLSDPQILREKLSSPPEDQAKFSK